MTIESAFPLHLVEFVVVFKYICFVVVLWEGCKIGEKEHPPPPHTHRGGGQGGRGYGGGGCGIGVKGAESGVEGAGSGVEGAGSGDRGGGEPGKIGAEN